MKNIVIQRIKKGMDSAPFPIVEFQEKEGIITFELGQNGMKSDDFNRILSFCEGRVISFELHFDVSNDCTYIKVQIGSEFGYYQYYDDWNHLSGKYAMLWGIEDVQHKISEWKELGSIPQDFEISEEKLKSILTNSLDTEYLAEVVHNSIHDYLIEEIE